jgi:transforming growth factor-beta-induced protein
MISKIKTLFFSLLVSGCMAGESATCNTVVDVAIKSPVHTTLVAAVTGAGLVDTLKGAGPFTVFAPTDEAFAADESLAKYLEPEWVNHLTEILVHHVASGKVTSDMLELNQNIEMVSGLNTTITSLDPPMINDAGITAADLPAKNGVVHVIDKVLNPLSSIVEIAVGLPDSFSTLVDLVVLAGLDEALQGDGPFTLFAPTNEAFAALDNATVQALLDDIPALTNVLLYHVLPGIAFENDVADGAIITMANNVTATLTVSSFLNGTETVGSAVARAEAPESKMPIFINNAMIVVTDILASNGVIHVIDSVLT